MLTYLRNTTLFDHTTLRPIRPFDPNGPSTAQTFTGSSDNDNFVGTADADTFELWQGGNDTASGRKGDDLFTLLGALDPADHLDGGAGYDRLFLSGDYSAGLTLSPTTLQRIDGVNLDGGEGSLSYDITVDDANVGAHRGMDWFMDLDLPNPGASSLHLDASAETDGDYFVRTYASGDDVITGGDGNDALGGGTGGTDILDGGAGFDRVSFGVDDNGVTVSLLLQGMAQDVGGGRMVTLLNFEDLGGSTFDDTLVGTDDGNWIYTAGGSDLVHGLAGDDYIEIDDNAFPVTVTVYGGAGIDTLSFAGGFVDVGVSLATTFSLALQGTVQSTTDGRDILANNFENVSGSTFDDNLAGDARANSIYGNSGADRLAGDEGDDALFGDLVFLAFSRTEIGRMDFRAVDAAESGADKLFGGDGKDRLFGGAGADTLDGGAGRDVLHGGDDADTFLFRKTADSPGELGLRDRLDFDHSEGDIIDLHHIDADTTVGGNQAFHWRADGNFTGAPGELIIVTLEGHPIVFGDVDGDGLADFGIELGTAAALAFEDVVL